MEWRDRVRITCLLGVRPGLSGRVEPTVREHVNRLRRDTVIRKGKCGACGWMIESE